ncbi:MAG: serine hydrolase domain-containing protein [Pseudomonadales bacterium]|nr:serine hydrolase domain-containing protein [Pseudomonadales bacterium]
MRAIGSFAFLLAIVGSGCAGDRRAQAPECALRAEMAAILADYRLPGMTVALAGPGGSVTVAGGLADREAGTPMTPGTTMLAASIGKTFVAAAVLELSEAGALDLDDFVGRWLGARPWFDRLPNARTITVRHLLQHRSGLPDYVRLPAFAERWPHELAGATPEDLIALTFEAGPLFPAGTNWSYTDTGYLLLGLLIEAVTGEPWGDVVRERFLMPLGLASTGRSDRPRLPGLACGYASPASGLDLPPRTTDARGELLWNPAVEGAGGGFYSTSRDLARWGQAFLSGRLLAADTWRQAIAGVPVSERDPDTRYGLGIAIRASARGPVLGHRGWIPGYVSSLAYYPEHDVAIAFQTNTDVGIVGHERPVVLEIEERLADVLIPQGAHASVPHSPVGAREPLVSCTGARRAGVRVEGSGPEGGRPDAGSGGETSWAPMSNFRSNQSPGAARRVGVQDWSGNARHRDACGIHGHRCGGAHHRHPARGLRLARSDGCRGLSHASRGLEAARHRRIRPDAG